MSEPIPPPPLEAGPSEIDEAGRALDQGTSAAEILDEYGFDKVRLVAALEASKTRDAGEIHDLPVEFKAANYNVEELRNKGFELASLFRRDADAYELADVPKMGAESKIPVAELRTLGYGLVDFKEAGYSASTLTQTGGWPKAEVKRVFSQDAEGTAKLEKQLKTDLEANQVDAHSMQGYKDELFAAARDMYEHRREKRAFKKEKKETSRYWKLKRYLKFRSLKNIQKDIAARIEEQQKLIGALEGERRIQVAREMSPESVDRGLSDAREAVEALENTSIEVAELIQAKHEDKDRYDDAKRQFESMLTTRVKVLAKQKSRIEGFIGKDLKALKSERKRELNRLNKRIKELGQSFDGPGGRPRDPVNALENRQAYTGLGDPAAITVEDLTDPYVPPGYTESTSGFLPTATFLKHLARNKYEKTFPGPLSVLAVVERRRELLTWSVDELGAEIEALKEYQRFAKNTLAICTYVGKIDRWFPVLMTIARSPRRVFRSSQILKKAGHAVAPKLVGRGELVKLMPYTGSRSFYIELSLSVGFAAGTKSGGANLSAGVNIVLAGKVSLDDDRRLRATYSIKLVPNFKAKVGSEAGPLFNASAKLGFTVLENTYAFVDEKHFAYYLSFRLANLVNFTNKFSRYGKTYAQSPIDCFDDDVQEILESILGDEQMDEMKYYLGERPVVKVITRQTKTASGDIGFTDAVTGSKVSLSVARKGVIFERSRLDTRSSEGSKTPEDEEKRRAMDQGHFWHLKARGDGDSLYNSVALLANYHSGTPSAPSDLRMTAAAEVLYAKRKELPDSLGHGMDTLFSEYLRHSTSQEYAKLDHIQALADELDWTIEIHTVAGTVYPKNQFTPSDGPSNGVMHLLFQAVEPDKPHFDPLVPRTSKSAPAIPGPLINGPIEGIAGFAQPKSGGQVSLVTQDHFSYAKEREGKKILVRRYAPRLITERRDGYSWSVSGGAGVKLYMSTDIEMGASTIVNNANPDNDGVYLNVKLKGGVFGRSYDWSLAKPGAPAIEFEGARLADQGDFESIAKDPEKHLAQLLGKNSKKLADLFQKQVKDAAPVLDAFKGAVKGISASFGNGQRYIELNFVQEPYKARKRTTFGRKAKDRLLRQAPWRWNDDPHKEGKELTAFRLQYTRWVYDSTSDVGIEINTGIPLNVGVGAGTAQTVALSEQIGVNTATYLVTVFNGLRLRYDGYHEWLEYLDNQGPWVHEIFRRVGKKPDCNIAYQFEQLEGLIRDNTSVWTDDAKWVKTERYDLRKACEEVQHEPASTERDAQTGRRPRPPSQNELRKILTTLLWRSQQVVFRENRLGNPWSRRVKYIVSETAKLSVDIETNDAGQPVVVGIPKFRPGKKGDLGAFSSVVDLYTNPSLADATNLLPFYQHGFDITLRIDLDRKKRKKLVKVRAIQTIEVRHPDGPDEVLQAIQLRVQAAAKSKKRADRTKYTEDLKHIFAGLHPGLKSSFDAFTTKLAEAAPATPEDVELEAVEIWEEFMRNPFDKPTPDPSDDGLEEILLKLGPDGEKPFILFSEK